ncbi:hypothetical protein PC110_g10520 [Phytophthora cactorum]|uniref:Uncharacterized protein n=1 Tax=Phytophthora cactorum TaxID=29920 RepID=A0A329S8K6_9STRA|nr:hypothetical protein PC110_g10520 [Phytophthora cactorum]
MSIASLAPANSKKTRVTAINSFNTFLSSESITLDAVQQLIEADKTGKADQNVTQALSGWRPKEGARLPSVCALEYPVLARAEKLQALLFTNTLGFADHDMNLE